MQPNKQNPMWTGLTKIIMSLCLYTLIINPTLSAEDMKKCQPCVQMLENCVEVVKKQKTAIESQKVVIKKQKDLIKEQKTYIVKKEADASISKLISGILSFVSILLVIL